MSRSEQIIDARRIGIFIKFVEERYISSTLKENLFFTSTDYFKNHEAKYEDKQLAYHTPNEIF